MTARAETGVAFIAELRGGGSVARPVATVTASGNGHRLVTTFNGRGHGNRPTGEPLTTVTTIERHGLITRHFGNVGGNPARHTTPAAEPVRVITTSGQQSVMTTELLPVDLDDVRFRMLEPREIKRAMDFPADYTLLGTRREQVRLSGNAVTPPCARDLVTVVAESLGVA